MGRSRFAIAIVGLLVAGLAGVAAPAPAEVAAQSCDPCPATVTVDLNLRKGPSLNDAVIRVIPAGSAVLRAAGSTNGFAFITYNGIPGWSAIEFILSDGGGAGPDFLTVSADLNLRAGPSFDDAVLLVMPAGSSVFRGADLVNGFRYVDYLGTSGWAYAQYLTGDDGQSGSDNERVTLVDLNLRAGPSAADAVILVMPVGSSLTLTRDAAANGYVTVLYNGTYGWAYADFLA